MGSVSNGLVLENATKQVLSLPKNHEYLPEADRH